LAVVGQSARAQNSLAVVCDRAICSAVGELTVSSVDRCVLVAGDVLVDLALLLLDVDCVWALG
jgi:hypothetical protein